MKTIIYGALFIIGFCLAISDGPYMPVPNCIGIGILFGLCVYGKEVEGWL